MEQTSTTATNVTIGRNQSLLHDINEEKAILLRPVMIIIGILMVIGVTGNILVWLFYGLKVRTTPAKCFIVCLASYDLVSCVLSMPMEIVELLYYYTYPSISLCKVMRFINYFASIGSACLLVWIAFDRYRKIRLPFKKQISVYHTKLAILATVVFAMLLAGPACYLYDVIKVSLDVSGIPIEVMDCTMLQNSTFVFVYNIILVLLFTLSIIILMGIYILVGRKINSHKKFQSKYTKRHNSVFHTDSNFFSESSDRRDPEPQEDCYSNDGYTKDSSEETDDYPTKYLSQFSQNGTKLVQIIESHCGSEITGVSSADDIREWSHKQGPNGNTPSDQVFETKEQRLDNITTTAEHQQNFSNLDDSENRDSVEMDRTMEIVSADTIDLNIKATELRINSSKRDSTINGKIEGNMNSIGFYDCRKPVIEKNMGENTHHAGNLDTGAKREKDLETEHECNNELWKNSYPLFIHDKLSSERSFSISANSDFSREQSDFRRRAIQNNARHLNQVSSVGNISTKSNLQKINSRKYTAISFSVTLAFVLSFLPYLGLSIWRSVTGVYEASIMSESQLIAFEIFMRSFMINSAVNPFIYGFFNPQFKSFVYTSIKGLFCYSCSH